MRSSFIVSALLPLIAIASPVEKRSASSIVTNINYINSNITALNTTLNSFSPDFPIGLLTALQIQSQNDNLNKAVDQTTSVVNTTSPLDDNDSLTVGLAFLNLQPNINSLLDNIVAHKKAFDTVILGLGGVGPLVESDLQKQNTSAAALGSATISKLSTTYQGIGQSVVSQIAAKFNSAIAAFANDGFIGKN